MVASSAHSGSAREREVQAARDPIAARIREMNAYVLAVQEVEDVDMLTHFAREQLRDVGYDHLVLVEGDDPA